MPDKPRAEFSIDATLVRALLTEQGGDRFGGPPPLAHTAEGWDCSVWRLGEEWAVRLPRRALAAPLVLHEQRVLPAIADRIAPTGIRVPAPLLHGRPAAGYPWPWSVVPWIDGTQGIDVARPERGPWARPLAAALGALHMPAPGDHPINAFRGVPLVDRSAAVGDRITGLRATHAISDAQAEHAAR